MNYYEIINYEPIMFEMSHNLRLIIKRQTDKMTHKNTEASKRTK